jgi:hypothetical protein
MIHHPLVVNEGRDSPVPPVNMYSFCSVLAREVIHLNKKHNFNLFFFCFGFLTWNLSPSAACGRGLPAAGRIALRAAA